MINVTFEQLKKLFYKEKVCRKHKKKFCLKNAQRIVKPITNIMKCIRCQFRIVNFVLVQGGQGKFSKFNNILLLLLINCACARQVFEIFLVGIE